MQDDHFIIKHLPPNTTSLIQPMDQGIIAKLKRSFRHKLTKRLVMYGSGADKFFKTYTIKHCIDMTDEAWSEITCNYIKNCWNKIISGNEEEQEEEDNIITEMQELLTSILEHTVTSEELEKYFNECDEEEEAYLRSANNADDSRDENKQEERVEDKGEEREEQWREEQEEEQEEERNENNRVQERGIAVNEEERKELEDIFRRLERYRNRIPRSSELVLEAMKLLFLGKTTYLKH